jgi:hypothetical protein
MPTALLWALVFTAVVTKGRWFTLAFSCLRVACASSLTLVRALLLRTRQSVETLITSALT